jgi:hypothetical protein
VIYRRFLDWMIGFIDTFYTPLGTTGKCSTIAISTLLEFNFTPTNVLSLHWLYPGNGFKTVSLSLMKSYFHSLITFLPLLSQLPTPELS